MIGTAVWKKHFTLKQFSAGHDNPTTFIICQWQTDKTEPNLKYLTYRAIVTILFFVTWVISMVQESGAKKWPIFLTNWGYTICTLQACLALFMLTSCVLATRLKSSPNLKHRALQAYTFYWILHTIATPLAFGITFIYWVVIYDATINRFNAMNYFVHGNNSILMMIDLWLTSHPIRILHFVYPAALGIVYAFFSAIYYHLGGTSKDGTKCIYKILDWDQPSKTAVVCIAVILFLICLHFVTFFIFKIRVLIDEKCCSKKEEISTLTESKREAAYYVNEAMSNEPV